MSDADDFVAMLERALATTANDTSAKAVEFRGHAQPVVDAARGRVRLPPAELAEHKAWLQAWMDDAGRQVREILDNVGGNLQDLSHEAKLKRFRDGG